MNPEFDYKGYRFYYTQSLNNYNCIIYLYYIDENKKRKYYKIEIHENLTHKLLEPILDDMIEKVEEDIKPKWKRMLEGTPMGEIFNV